MYQEVTKFSDKSIAAFVNRPYRYGFKTDLMQVVIPQGLDEDTIYTLFLNKREPGWILQMRLQAFHFWQQKEQPIWSDNKMDHIDYQTMSYFAKASLFSSAKKGVQSGVINDSQLIATFSKLGINLDVHNRSQLVAVDAIFDSVSIATTYKSELEYQGVIFSSVSDAVGTFPELLRKFVGCVVPSQDNFFFIYKFGSFH